MRRILCFGDSNTWGYIPGEDGMRFDETIRWPMILQKELGDDFRVIEEGHCGRTTVFEDVIETKMAGIDYFAPCLASQAPLEMVILMLGVNDLKTRFNVTAWDIADGFERYLNAIKTAKEGRHDIEVLLISPVEVDPGYRDHPVFSKVFGNDAVERSKEFAAAYEAFAHAHGIHFLDAAQYASASPIDGIHLDEQSHRNLGMAVTKKVQEILK